MTLPMIFALAITVFMIALIMVDKLPFGVPPLIACLLMVVFGVVDIKTAFEGGDYEEVAKKLVHFRSSLQAHLLTENVRLYIYLSHRLANDEINSELIHEFRREMDAIARVAMNFLKKYDTIGVDKELAGAFAKDFATIGQVLTERIEKEERVLYPLYLPCY